MAKEDVSGLLSRWVKSLRHRRVLPHLRPGMTLLDVGCGLGELCGRLPQDVRFIGIDREPEFIAHCRRRYPRHVFLEGDFFDLLPRLPTDLDVVLLLAVLEHAPRPEAFFPAAYGLLKPHGALIATTPSPHSGPWHALGVRLGMLSGWAQRDHQALLGPERIRAMGGQAGFLLRCEERFLCGLNQFYAWDKEIS